MNLNEGNPSKLAYVLTAIFAVVSVALCFGLFQAVMTTLVGRFVVSLALAISVSLPFVGVMQDAFLYRKKGKDEDG